MKVDYHIHLEEGPYSLAFMAKSMKAIERLCPLKGQRNSKEWFTKIMKLMNKRVEESEYSEWWLDFYLQQALNRGIKEVGIVDHLYRFKETKEYFMRFMDVTSEEVGQLQKDWLDKVMVRSLADFVDLITAAKQKWASKGVRLRLGMEADYFEGGEEELRSILDGYPFDYIIGSVHFYRGWGFDNPDFQHKFKEHNLYSLYEDHFSTVKKAAESGVFDFIAHLDNVKVFNYRPDESMLIDLYRSVAKALKKNDVATEINPGLYYRYPVKEMCPSPHFLHILLEEGVIFTTSSDSHFPNDLGIFSNEIQDMLRGHGVDEIATFDKRNRIMQRIDEPSLVVS